LKLATLKLARFIVPGVIATLYAAFFGYLTDLWSFKTPTPENALRSIFCIVPAILYYVTPLRHYINKPHHDNITEHIRTQLVGVSGRIDDPEKYSWKILRPFYFSKIDDDKSLTIKSELAYSNGLIWTTCADSTALSAFAILLGLILGLLGHPGGWAAATVFCLIAIVSFLGSLATTRKQRQIADEQIEIFEMSYKGDLQDRLDNIG
jgi:hypothetical protein